jgi:hypothetical protein
VKVRRVFPRRTVAAIAGATAVLAGCLATSPLFLSSAATAATRLELQGRCPARVAANFTGSYLARDRIVSTLAGPAKSVAYAGRPAVTDQSVSLALTMPHDDGIYRSAIAVHREGGLGDLGVTARRGSNGVFVPDWFASQFHLAIGQSLGLAYVGAGALPVTIIGTYRDAVAAVSPEWCMLASAFQPNQFGDHQPPVLVFDDEGAAAQRGLFAGGRTTWVLPFAGNPTAATTASYLRTLRPLRGAGQRLGADFDVSILHARVATDLDFVTHRAREIRSFTDASMAPVRWSGALTGIALVVGVALLFARRHRRELRIRVLRGAHPFALGTQAAARVSGPVVVGAAAGAVAAGVLVHTFGPSPVVDGSSRSAAARLALVAVLVTLATVAATVAATSRAVDRRRSLVPRLTWLRRVPVELALAAVSLVAFRHLVQHGGVELAGADASRIDAWAVLFPLLLIWTVLLAAARPLRALLRRGRALGGTRSPAVMLGLRRAVNDPAVGMVTCGAVALCLATFVYASTLSTSINASLHAKAETFVGADQRVALTQVPALDAALARHATIVTRAQGRFRDASVTVLGVDPPTFARIAHWQRSFGSLSRSMAAIGERARGALPVVVAGTPLPGAGNDVVVHGRSVVVRVAATTRLWPSMQADDIFVVAERDALRRLGIDGIDEVWLRGAGNVSRARLTAGGAGIVYSVDQSSVLDFNNALPVRWSLGLLSALGLVAGLAFAAAELAIIDGRARARQLAYVMWQRMGLRAGAHRVACMTELAFPAAVGAVAATVTALLTARLVVDRLDALRSLPPPGTFVLSVPSLALGGVVVAAIVVVLAGWSQHVTESGNAVELLRVAE